MHEIVSFRGDPVLAVPAGLSSTSTNLVLDNINTYTWRRFAFVAGLRLGLSLGLHKFMFSPHYDLIQRLSDCSEEQLLSEMASISSIRISRLAVIWPWPPKHDRGRVYLIGVSSSGVPVAFVKLSIRPEEDAPLANEADVLLGLRDLPCTGFAYPSLLGLLAVEGRSLLMLDIVGGPLSAPTSRDLTRARRSVADARPTHRLNRHELERTSWWAPASRLLGERDGLRRLVHDHVDSEGIATRLVHADLNPQNVSIRAGETVIVDWEKASLAGPVDTDFVAAQLDSTSPRPTGIDHLFVGFRGHAGAMDRLLALLYLCSVDHRRALEALNPTLDLLETRLAGSTI